MTRMEWDAAMTRYMHRNDLSADLDLTFELATQRINERLMRSDTDTALILQSHPSLYLHAGLMQLAELAQDDKQLEREVQLFERATTDYAFKNSISKAVAPQMEAPYGT